MVRVSKEKKDKLCFQRFSFFWRSAGHKFLNTEKLSSPGNLDNLRRLFNA